MTVNNDAIAFLKVKVDLPMWMVGFDIAMTVAVLFVLVKAATPA